MMKELFDIIPEAERSRLKESFYHLEENHFKEAVELFNEFISGNFSTYTKSFANYGLGVAGLKKIVKEDSLLSEDIDYSIDCFKKSLKTLEHADTHLMLGYAWMIKINDISKKEEKIDNLSDLVDRAIVSFHRAVQLNPSYTQDAKESIARLKNLKNKSYRT